jgi:hypothetical protein
MKGANGLRFASALIAGALLLAGCGGGGGSAPSSVPEAVAPSGNTGTAKAQSGTITLRFPARGTSSHARSPQYVSPSSAAIVITIVSVNGITTLPPGVPSPTTVALSTLPGGNCTVTLGIESCVIPVPTPPGSVVYNLQILGPAPANAVLSENTFTLTILAGANGANYSAALLGLVAGVNLTPPSFAFGVPSNGAVVIQPLDATGATITGTSTFSAPFTLTDNDTQDGTSLTNTNGPQAGASVTVFGPSDVIKLVYPGGGPNPLAPFTLTVSGASIPAGYTPGGGTVTPQGAVAFTGTYVGSAATGVAPGDPNFGAQTLFFATIGQQLTFTATQSSYSGPFTIALDPTTCTGPVATYTTADQKTFAVTAAALGICKATVTGGSGANATLWLSVTTANFNIQ